MSTAETVEESSAAAGAALNVAETIAEPTDALNKSYDSMGSQEQEEPHYNFDSDGEPPQDEVGDKLTIIHKRQVVKEILETGADLGKPGRPFIVTVELKGYFAKPESRDERKAKLQAIKEKNRANVRIIKKEKKKRPPKKKFAEDGEEAAGQESEEDSSDYDYQEVQGEEDDKKENAGEEAA